MKSLRDLNRASNQGLPFNDDRDPVFEYTTPTNQQIFAYEGKWASLNSDLTITSLINSSNQYANLTVSGFGTLTSGFNYVIDLSQYPDARIEFDGITANAAGLYKYDRTVGTGNLWVYHNDASNYYTVGGIKNIADWELFKTSANLILPQTTVESGLIQSYLETANSQIGWDTYVSIGSLEQLSSPDTYYFAVEVDQPLLGVPTASTLPDNIFANENNVLTISYTGNTVANLTSTVGSFNSGTKKYTITGNISTINSGLSNLRYQPPSGYNDNFDLYYSLYNSQSNWYSNVTQHLYSVDNTFLHSIEDSAYNHNTVTYLEYPTEIVDTWSNANVTYSLTISGTNVTTGNNAIYSMSSGGTGGTAYFEESSKSYIAIGSKSVVNTYLANLSIRPITDTISNIRMNYSLSISNGINVLATQNLSVQNIITPVSNTTVTTYALENTANQIFFSNAVPHIDESLVDSPNYTLTLTVDSNTGKFGLVDTSVNRTVTYTGGKDYINTILPTIKFYPKLDAVGGHTYNMSITRLGNTVVNSTNTLTIVENANPVEGIGTYTYYYGDNFPGFTYEQRNYLLANLLLVGGGGGTHVSSVPSANRHYGGAGGGAVNEYTQVVFADGYDWDMYIGAGAVASTNPSFGETSRITRNGIYVYSANGGFYGNSKFNGGSYTNSPYKGAVGTSETNAGGGAGAGASASGRNGGAGKLSTITGQYYGGGGGGQSTGTGGTGGGGAHGANATQNTGGGGGGDGGSGANGLIVVKFYKG